MCTKVAYKLLRRRRDGSLGPLFINRRQRIPVGAWLPAEDIPTKGYAHRPGWHCCCQPYAPHLSERGRVWYVVELEGVRMMRRPASQGGTWYLAEKMCVIGPYANHTLKESI